MSDKADFNFLVEQFADLKIMRYQVPGFESLSLNQKKLLYFLSQAALCGRDIIFDQNYKHNLIIRATLEKIYKNYKGDRATEEFKQFEIYLKRLWFSNGIHHLYSMDKILPDFSIDYFKELLESSPAQFKLPKAELLELLIPILFDPEVDSKRVSLDGSKDLITYSSCN